MAYKDDLTRICAISYPSNHLFNATLMHRKPSTQYIDKKPQYFVFVSLIPGEKTGSRSTDRTYNFENAINLKFSLAEVEGISFILKQVGIGRGQFVLPYAKFANMNQVTKSVTVWEPNPSTSSRSKSRIISLTVTVNNSRQTINMSPAESYSLGEQLHELFKVGTKLEFKAQYALDNAQNKNSTYNNSKYDKSVHIQESEPVATPNPNEGTEVNSQVVGDFENMLDRNRS